MHIFCFIICCLSLLSCEQKKFIININDLKEQELRIYHDKQEYPQLVHDSLGNFIVTFDSSNVLYTSTSFVSIEDLHAIFCFKNPKPSCYNEVQEIENLGFTVDLYSHFSSDPTGKAKYVKPYTKILIKKINK